MLSTVIHDREYYVGIDPSLSATGLVMINERGEIVEQRLINTELENYLCIEQRLLDIMSSIIFLNGVMKLSYVYIEDLPYLSKGGAIFERAGLLYLITTFLFQNNIPYKLIKPTTLKKWSTGSGRADKADMMNEALTKYGIEFTDDNLCDAFFLSQMARLKNIY